MKCLKIFIVFFVFSVLSQIVFAQTNEVATANLKKQAEEMVGQFSSGNLKEFIKYTYPKVFASVGGEAKMLSIIKKEMDKWAEQGISILSVSVGDPGKIVKAGSELHALLTQTLTMKVPGGKMSQKSHLLAISPNNGSKWYFLDTAPLNSDNIRKLFPNFNNSLVLPAKEDPVVTRD